MPPDFLFEIQSHGVTQLQPLLFPSRCTPFIGCICGEAGPGPISAGGGINCLLVQAPNLALLSKDAICPNKQCWVLEVILKRAYLASALATRLGNYNIILVACQSYFLRFLSDSHSPSPLQLDELRLVNKNLLRLSKINGQAVGRNMAALMQVHLGIFGFSQSRMPYWDKALLLDVPVTLGHTFGPAVDEMLQRSQPAWELAGSPASQAITSSAQTCSKLAPKAPASSASETLSHKPSSSPGTLLPQVQTPFSGNHLEYWHQYTIDIWVFTTVQTSYSLQFGA